MILHTANDSQRLSNGYRAGMRGKGDAMQFVGRRSGGVSSDVSGKRLVFEEVH